jgi:2'-5' RNA ligase
MRLFAVITPPRPVLDEVRQVVRGSRGAPGAPSGGAHRRPGLLGRLGSRSAPSAETDGDGADGGNDELTVPSVDRMYLPLTGFGNVTLGDSVQLVEALRTEAATWTPPTVHLAGGTALEFRGDESVWAKIAGDVDGLQMIGRTVPQVVQRLGFFVDRRQFRPWLAVGTITEATTAPYLEGVVARLEAFSGRPWVIDTVTVMRRVPEKGPDAFEVHEELPLLG